MAQEKTIQQQIDEIIEHQYSGYRDRIDRRIKPLHDAIRKKFGDSMFLVFLEKQERFNPRK